MMAGDFYMVLIQNDKRGDKPASSSSRGGLQKMVDEYGLIDMGFQGNAFTWNNRRSGMANIQERLDRDFANASWKLQFPEATVNHLTVVQSDHRPILINTVPSPYSLPKPFQFESMWITHPDIFYIIQDTWNRSNSFLSLLKNTKEALK